MKNKMPVNILILLPLLVLFSSCRQEPARKVMEREFRIIQLDPTHSHGAAAQAEQLALIDTTVYVYAPDSNSVAPYFQQIKSFNTRNENPAKWREVSWFGSDYLERMVAEKKGNVVVLAGNNRLKIDYIEQSVKAGMNVFSDKPMVINKAGFERLKNIWNLAGIKGVILFDMMTERYNPIHRIQRSLMQDTTLFGHMLPGTPDHPSIMESSVHHFYRGGKGTRPAWFFDVLQQGEGIVDVTTHLIDLSFWKSFPDETIDYTKEVNVLSAKHWPVTITRGEFSAATSLPGIPSSLNQYMKDSVLEVYANGSINYQAKGVNISVKVEWRPATPPGGNDLRSAYARGTKCTLLIQQEPGQNSPKLCIEKGEKVSEPEFRSALNQAITRLQSDFPGISFSEIAKTVQINIPSELNNSCDPTFKVFIGHLKNRDLPKWEVPNTLAKYYITTTALEMAKGKL